MKELDISEKNELIKRAYYEANYRVEYSELCDNDRCILFFSGNGLYYPDTEEEFVETVLTKDRYEWSTVGHSEEILSAFHMIVYLRDVYKSWYEKGINQEINSIAKLVEFVRKLTRGYKVITCGNSAGGYIAHIIGYEIEAERVFDWGGQWRVFTRFRDQYLGDETVSKFYDSTSYAGPNILYFYSDLCKADVEQFSYVEDTDVIEFPIKSAYHGALLLNGCYKYILSLDSKEIDKLVCQFSGRSMSPRKWAWVLLSGKERLYAIWGDLVSSHHSLQIIRETVNRMRKV